MSKLFGDDYNGRKAIPIFEGVVMYFPKALAAVAEVSQAGNKQHNPGQPLHWARGKSMDQFNTALRHMMDHRMGGGRVPYTDGHPDDTCQINNGWVMERHDADGVRHLAKAAWRVLAALQLAIEEEEARAVKALPANSHWFPEAKAYRYDIDFDRTEDCQSAGVKLVYCWKPMCEGHKIGEGTHSV